MDPDLFWQKDLLRANEDMLFSCFIDPPKGTPAVQNTVKGLFMGTFASSRFLCNNIDSDVH